ncbi:GntR family transcriptional regulator [Streptomyces roseofulvus]|uniref:GntR family transcriptional regulator n=1 Tax=Streptomyces roseofulvus TaxID=33902 RepID=UPI0031FD622A
MSGTDGRTAPGSLDLAALYRRRILKGEMAPGDPMPTLKAATEEHGVAKGTVVRAYDVLKREGLIQAHPGRGTVVASLGLAAPGGDRIERVRRGGNGLLPGETSTEHHAGVVSIDDRAVVEALGIDFHDEVGVRERVYVREGGKRYEYAVSYYGVRARVAVPELVEEGVLPSQWPQIYEERTGLSVHRHVRYGARIATQHEMRKFHQFADPTSARAVLVVTTEFSDDAGPLAVWEDVYAPGETIPGPPPAE